MKYFGKYTILSVEKKVGGLIGIACCPPDLIVGYSRIIGGLNIDYSPQELEVKGVDSVDVLVCQGEGVEAVYEYGDKGTLENA